MFFYSICYKAYENQRIFDDNVDNKGPPQTQGPKTLRLTHRLLFIELRCKWAEKERIEIFSKQQSKKPFRIFFLPLIR